MRDYILECDAATGATYVAGSGSSTADPSSASSRIAAPDAASTCPAR